jgi:hypothetical protein
VRRNAGRGGRERTLRRSSLRCSSMCASMSSPFVDCSARSRSATCLCKLSSRAPASASSLCTLCSFASSAALLRASATDSPLDAPFLPLPLWWRARLSNTGTRFLRGAAAAASPLPSTVRSRSATYISCIKAMISYAVCTSSLTV